MKIHTQRLTPAQCLELAHKPGGQHADTLAHRYQHPSSHDSKWLGFKGQVSNPAELVKAELSNGWAEGGAMLARVSAEVTAMIPASRKLKIESDHAVGFDPCVSDLLQGRPFAFRQWGKRPKAQIIRLIANMSASASYGADALVWSGAATMVLADLYTQAGYSVEIFGANFVGSDGDNKLLSLVTIKEASEQLMPDLLASVLVSPRFYRVGVIPLCWQVDPSFAEFGSGAGRVDTLTGEILNREAPELCPAVILPRVFDRQSAINQVNATIDSLTTRAQE